MIDSGLPEIFQKVAMNKLKVILFLIISYSERILKVLIKEDYVIKSLLTVLGVLATLRSVSNLELVDGGC